VLPEAARGNQVAFAAPGADMVAASATQTFAPVRGTSFAAPIVAGILANSRHALSRAAADEAIENLARAATDLGAPGRDPVYGYGLVGEALRPPATLASTR
jgi:subtilisin family serine protease